MKRDLKFCIHTSSTFDFDVQKHSVFISDVSMQNGAHGKVQMCVFIII